MWGIEVTGGWAVVAALVLLPGLLAALIRDGLSETKAATARQLFISAMIFDFVIYIALLGLSPLGVTAYPSGHPFSIMTVVAAFLLAVAIGVVAGVCSSRGVWQRLFFRWGWTKKGPTNTWMDAFQLAERRGAWAYVHLKDGRRILGLPKYYSTDSSNPELFLMAGLEGDEPVEFYAGEGANPVRVQGPGVLITPNAEISLVCFLDGLASQ